MAEAIVFRFAEEKDGRTITQLRQRIWQTTYRGIYPDDLIDDFDYVWHLEKDIKRIRSNKYLVFLILTDDIPIGYMILRKDNNLLLQSLYVLPRYQRCGIGAKAFALIRRLCKEENIQSFTCHCHPDNLSAITFYQAMGGQIVAYDTDNDEHWQDSIILSFPV